VAAPRVVAAIVNFNSADHVARLAGRLDGVVDRAVVVDNNSRPDDVAALRALADRHRWLRLHLLDANLGFGAGVNRAVARLAPHAHEAIWILNPDIEPDPGAGPLLARLLATAAGPRIVSPLIVQGPAGDERVWFMGGRIDWRRGTTEHEGWGAPAAAIGEAVIETGFVTGAAPMLTGETWSRLGGFREDYFLYWEDADLSARASAAGLPMAVHCGARVRHLEGASSDGDGRGRVYYEYGTRNRQAFLAQWRPHAGWAQRRLWDVEVARLAARAVREPQGRAGKAAAVLAARFGPRRPAPTGQRALQPGIRVIPELRAAHVEEIDAVSPRELWYFTRNYDMAVARLPPHARRRTLPGACLALLRVRSGTLELHEPLWARYLPAWVLLAAVWRFSRFGRPRSRRAAFFAIENLDPAESLAGGDQRRLRPARACVRAGGWLVRRLAARCAFGTAGAEAVYRPLLRGGDVITRVIPDLPARAPASRAPVDPGAVVFVGALERRKGVIALMAAWEIVEADRSGATLTLVGDGIERERVRAWVARRPASRRALGLQPRSEIATLLDGSAVLVAPSLRAPHWREQVGRPIQEAIRAGMTVVTTGETGLAEFLRAGGHRVVDPAGLPDDLARSLVDALSRPLPREHVRATLPEVPGRVVADRWLHASDPREQPRR
jgi:GT2 family glycosyltransferase